MKCFWSSTELFLGYEENEGKEGKEAFKEAFQVKEAIKEALKEALQEALKETLRLQELRGFVPFYGRDESFCYGGDGNRALCSQVGFIITIFLCSFHLKVKQD